jgi:hypothetical protein
MHEKLAQVSFVVVVGASVTVVGVGVVVVGVVVTTRQHSLMEHPLGITQTVSCAAGFGTTVGGGQEKLLQVYTLVVGTGVVVMIVVMTTVVVVQGVVVEVGVVVGIKQQPL